MPMAWCGCEMPTFTVFPVADLGGSAGWQSTGTKFWQQLDEDPHDGDTSYIQAGGDAVTSRTFQFAMQRIGFPDATLVPTVAVTAMGKRFDTGQNVAEFSFKLRLYLYIPPLTYLVATQQIEAAGDYLAVSYSSATSPATGQAWKPSEVQRLSPIVEVIQAFDNVPRVGAFGRFTQIYGSITFIAPTWTERRASSVSS